MALCVNTCARLMIGLAAVLAAFTSPARAAGKGGAAEVPGGTLAQWAKHREAICKEPALGRYYTFEGIRAAGDRVANLAAGKEEPLVFVMEPVAGAARDEFKLVEGRWPGKQAVRLDQGYFTAKAAPVPGRAFTATMWFRKHGQGAHRGNSGSTNGTLLAVGNGYWEGWRLTTSYPSSEIGFEIGRPQPSSSVGTNTGPVADGVWHHLAATWDGQQMRIYVDGELSASRAYDGAYTKPAPGGGDWLRVGYADSGMGSAIMDVDEVAIYSRALSADEIVGDLYFYAGLSAKQLAQWSAANGAVQGQDLAAGERGLTELLKSEGLDRDVAAAVSLRLIDVRLQQGSMDATAAAGELARLVDVPSVPSRLNRQAMIKLLGLLKGGAVVPRAVYEKFLVMTEISATDRLSLRLGLGHSLAAGGDLAGAREQYAKIADDGEVSAPWRGLALMSIAKAQVRAGDYAAAKQTYAKVKGLVGVPRYWAVVVDERVQEIERLEAGKPARDGLAGRTSLPARPRPGATLYVAADGKDSNDGSKGRPFASLERARDQIRAMRRSGALPAGGVKVVVGGGRYSVKSTFQLGTEDSGTATTPIVYVAAPGETPILDAGQRIGGFEVVRDEAILARLPEEARGKVYQTNLKGQGVADLGVLELGGFASGRGFMTHPMLELFFNGQAMPMARWPNEGYVHIAEVPQGTQGVFTYEGDRPARWKDEKDGWLYGYWFYDWADGYEKIAKVDPALKQITLAPPFSKYGTDGQGFKAKQRFYAVNMLCEIDRPGEWYVDRGTGVLYFFAPSDPAKATVQVSMFEKPMVEMDHVSQVTLEGLTWENGRGDGILIKEGEACLLAGCALRQFGGNGVEITGGSRHGILSCDIHTLGRGGTMVTGGDRKTLTAAGHFVENCHIYDFSRIDHTYTPAVLLSGVGDRTSHNLFHDANSSAMRLEGNDHVVEFNEVRNVLKDSDDQGASDMWGNPTYRGNVLRYNYWHDMGNGLDCGQAGIRLDDFISGVVIYGNIFQRCAAGGFGGIQMNQGKDNQIENNLFIQCKAAISGGSADEQGWQKFLNGPTAKRLIEEVKVDQPPYSVRYPELQKLDQNHSNNVWRNVVVNCGTFVVAEQRMNQMDNQVGVMNPGLESPAAGNFAVKQGSPLWNRLSFDTIPVDEIGMYADAYRKAK